MKLTLPRALLLCGALVGAAAQAQTTIDQNKALAGGITPGDAPGFPITLSVPGSYKLTSNLVVPPNVHGVQITASNVTLDLNGFSITGPITCTGSGPALTCSPGIVMGVILGPVGSVVRNGTISGFFTGIYSVGQLGIASRAEQLRVFGNAGNGIVVNDGGIAVDNVVYRNGIGIALADGLAHSNVVHDNKTDGISLINGSLAIDNTASGNGVGINASGWSGHGRNALANNVSPVVGGIKLATNSCNFSAC